MYPSSKKVDNLKGLERDTLYVDYRNRMVLSTQVKGIWKWYYL